MVVVQVLQCGIGGQENFIINDDMDNISSHYFLGKDKNQKADDIYGGKWLLFGTWSKITPAATMKTREDSAEHIS